MGAAQDLAARKRNPAVDAEGGEKVTDAQLDAMKERNDMRLWESQNRVDPHAEKAVEILTETAETIWREYDNIREAASTVAGSDNEDKIDALANSLEALVAAIEKQIERMK